MNYKDYEAHCKQLSSMLYAIRDVKKDNADLKKSDFVLNYATNLRAMPVAQVEDLLLSYSLILVTLALDTDYGKDQENS